MHSKTLRYRGVGINSIIVGTLVIFLSVLSCAVRKPHITLQSTSSEFEAAKKVKALYDQDLRSFREKLVKLEKSLLNDSSQNVQISTFLEAREQFKRCEYLLNYIDNNFTKQFNGPNINRAEGYPSKKVMYLEPHGLQVIEELIYEQPENSQEMIMAEITNLKKLLDQMIDNQPEVMENQANSLNAVIWDALRMEVYRIESLGITGFDVPISKNAVPETIKSLEGMINVIECYESASEEKNVIKFYKKGIKTINKAIQFCQKNTDFNSFDRITFCREHLHELSGWINVMTKQLDMKLPTGQRPFNEEATHIFDEHFFDVNYFLKGYTDEKAELGRKLFFDPVMSTDGTRSCATCHDPEMFFSDRMDKNFKLDKSGLLGRNTPTLYNAIWQTRQFYDSRVHNLEEQAFAVIHNKDEMGGNLNEIAVLLNKDEAYLAAFAKAYDQDATPKNISHAIASYVATLTSNNSRFDLYIRKESNSYSKAEKNGFNLFMGKAQCATCHFPPMFNGLVPPQYIETESENIGTPTYFDVPNELDPDEGKYNFSKVDLHKFFFKTPSVRNSNMSAPMMHNGAFPNIRTVIEFYNNGGGSGQGADNPTQTLSADSLHLSNYEIFELIQFIRSLEDDSNQ